MLNLNCNYITDIKYAKAVYRLNYVYYVHMYAIISYSICIKNVIKSIKIEKNE